jgi:cytochrome c oxidase cbb3-type subunit 3
MCSRFPKTAAIVFAMLLSACGQPKEQPAPPAGAIAEGNRVSELQPGPPIPVRQIKNPFEGSQEAIADGKRLYNDFNCSGCHAAGGGAIGPPLMDDEWIYGSSPSNIFWTIVEGRPQGMPAYGGRITEDQVWRIAAFVRSLSGLDKESPEKTQPAKTANE